MVGQIKPKKVRLKISLYTRFMIAISFILVLLVGTILYVIEKREVKTIFEEVKNRGILVARNIAYLNLEGLKFWDYEGVNKNIEDQIDDNLLYVVMFDRFSSSFVASESVREKEDITCCSRLPQEITEDIYYFGSGNFERDGRVLPMIELEIPIFASGSPSQWGSIKVGLSLEEMQAEVRKTRLVLILLGGAGFLLGIVGAALLARRITDPLKKLVEGTVRISRGDFTQQIKITSQDEIGNLAQSFNEMTRELLETRKRMEEANKKLIQSEKLASIGRISATIAHEIRNPLTSVKLNIQKAIQNEDLDETEREHLNISQEGISQIEKFIKELLNFTRVSELHLERFPAEQIIEEAVKMMNDSFREKRVILEKNYREDLPHVLVDGDKMRQVILNILRNSLEAVEEGGKINLDLALAEENGAKKIRINISDNGCGIPDKDWENIFEPFYTTKPSGFGLGLANARKIVELHSGSIRVVKKRGKGTSFEVRIPCEVEA